MDETEARTESDGDTMRSLCVAPYYTGRPDPQRGERWPADSHTIVRTWADSLERCGVSGLILHDGSCSPSFRTLYTRPNEPWLGFRKVEPIIQGSVNDDRFFQFKRLVEGRTDVGRWMFTDISDVEFYRDPFEVMINQDCVYIGSEPSAVGENAWVRAHLVAGYGEFPEHLSGSPVFNCGIIGGHREKVLEFLGALCTEIECLRKAFSPTDLRTATEGEPSAVRSWIGRTWDAWVRDGFHADMPALQMVADEFDVVTGPPLHTEFRANEGPGSGAYIRHK